MDEKVSGLAALVEEASSDRIMLITKYRNIKKYENSKLQ